MTIDQISIIDAIGVDNVTDELVLTIIDHLEWEGNDEHLMLLQEKINTYLAFVESGELMKTYPESKGRSVAICLVCAYRLTKQAEAVFDRITAIVQDAGVRLTHKVFGEN
jgi:hypothetical protein